MRRVKVNMTPIPARLRAALDNADMNARDLAARLGIHESTVSLWLSGGRTPRMKNLVKIAEALHIEVTELWDGPEAVPTSAVQMALLDEITGLTAAQQEALLAVARSMKGGT
jgi:transcriptional regulator with XRE-family HTH domain